MSRNDSIKEVLRAHLHEFDGSSGDYDPLLEIIGESTLVLLGESSHGTHEFYRERARITRRLVEEKGFSAIAVEADWPDAYRLNRYARGESDDAEAVEALGEFRRFPLWMWRNTEIVELAGWLREHNSGILEPNLRVGFYGIDLYSMFTSIEAVIGYLEQADPTAAAAARERYACFDHFGEDSQAYGYASTLDVSASCEQEAVQQLVDLRRRAADLAHRDGRIPRDEFFFAEQNARLVKNAEEYYRSMFRGRTSSWNLRDSHMTDTVEALRGHLGEEGEPAKIVVWAHNSHLGDASATQMGATGEWNVGQLCRERFGREAVLVGFTTYTGEVTAASNWGEPADRRWVRPGLPSSFEDLFHRVDRGDFLLPLRSNEVRSALGEPRIERAIGVIYRPETERGSHYFLANLPDQFDVILHFDETTALTPLDTTPAWERGEVPDTYPFEV